jgi:hypothetical protein
MLRCVRSDESVSATGSYQLKVEEQAQVLNQLNHTAVKSDIPEKVTEVSAKPQTEDA